MLFISRLKLKELFFFPFSFSSYGHSVGHRVVSIISGSSNQSFSELFYVVFELFVSMRQLSVKTILFQIIKFSIYTQFSSIWPIDRILSGATTGPRNDGNEGVLCFPQSSIITVNSSSDCLMSYPGHSLGWGSYLSAEKQSVYSTDQSAGAVEYTDCSSAEG